MSSYINRSSIGMYLWVKSFIADDVYLGHAKLMGLETDLHISPSETNWAVSLFFLAYVRELHTWSLKSSNISFISAHLWNSKLSFCAFSRSKPLFILEYDFVGDHHCRHGFCQRCSTATYYSFSSRKLI
jgi:hypothetical protein